MIKTFRADCALPRKGEEAACLRREKETGEYENVPPGTERAGDGRKGKHMLLNDPRKYFSELYEIYEASFPEVERRTEQDQRKVWENPVVDVRTVEMEGKTAAFLTCWKLENCRFLEHLATAPGFRGHGLGRRLVEECVEEAEKAGLPLLLEIEPVTEEEPDTVRRAAFYERLGFVVNRFPYEQPPLQAGAPRIPLWVVSHGRPVNEEEFAQYKREIYRKVYGEEL